MRLRQNVCRLLIVVIVVVIVATLILVNRRWKKESVEQISIHVSHKKFIYLVQTEQCIPDVFISGDNSIGNPEECQCDVIVFSFKEKCLNLAPSHVEYIDPRPSTLNIGKNIMYQAAMSRNTDYLYYIFSDDDVEFQYNEKYTPFKMKSVPPLRSFEKFLISHEPAVGVPNYVHHHNSEQTIESFKDVCFPHIKPNQHLLSNRTFIGTEMPLYLTVVYFDAMFNAYHRDTMRDLLPFTTMFDKDWTYSQLQQIIKVELMFRGHAVMFTPVNAKNNMHRSYSRVEHRTATVAMKQIITEVSQDIPSQFSNKDWIQEFLDEPLFYQEHSLTYCFKLPPKHPIKVYSHFYLNWAM